MSFPCHFVIVVGDVVDVLLFPCLFYIIPAFLASGFSISGFLFFSFFSFCPFLLYFSLFVFVWFVGWNLARVLLRPTWFFSGLYWTTITVPLRALSIRLHGNGLLPCLFVCLLNTKKIENVVGFLLHTHHPFSKCTHPQKICRIRDDVLTRKRVIDDINDYSVYSIPFSPCSTMEIQWFAPRDWSQKIKVARQILTSPSR